MTAPTINGAKYPQPVEALLPKARELARELGEVPSRNRLMREYRIGAPKADELRTILAAEWPLLAVQAQSLPRPRALPPLPSPVGSAKHGPDCYCPLCNQIRAAVAERGGLPNDGPAAEATPDLTGLSDVEMLRTAVDIADERGELPAAAEYAAMFGIKPDAAELLTSLVALARRRRAAGLPVYDDDPADEPARDPWDYAEPIGPNPVPAETPDRAEAARTYNLVRGGTGGATDADIADAARRVAADPDTSEFMRGVARGVLDGVDQVDIALDGPPAPRPEPAPKPSPAPSAAEPDAQVTTVGHPGTPTPAEPAGRVAAWPVILLALPAFVAIWGGWVGLGALTGFGPVDLLPGFTRENGQPLVTLNTAITLPIGMETYGTYALYVWLSGRVPDRARRFAMWSAIASLTVGAAGQVVYHLLVASGATKAPWPITTAVACLPVAVLGMGAALAHLVREGRSA